MTESIIEEITIAIHNQIALPVARVNSDKAANAAKAVLYIIEKRIDKVEQDYKNELNNWGKSQPMKDMFPKEMETLERVRKELFGINNNKKK